MSPRTSEQDRRLAAIEALVCRDVGRKTQALIDANRGGLAAAAAALATATRVGLITGFFVPRGDVAAPETDGPVGTALLAAALAACGVPARIAVDTPSVEAVRSAVRATEEDVAVDEIVLSEEGAIDATTRLWRQENLSHVVAIERCGRSADGRPRNMRGVDVSPWTLPLDTLFEGGDWTKLAVGDGGNEIGMGNADGALRDLLIYGDKQYNGGIVPAHITDAAVPVTVSNWGGYGIAAALAAVLGRPDIVHDEATERRMLLACSLDGLIDGVTGSTLPTSDGMGEEIHVAIVTMLRTILGIGVPVNDWPATAPKA